MDAEWRERSGAIQVDHAVLRKIMNNITCLIENTKAAPEFEREHGLSLYIETENHKLLSDTGQSGLFLKNADRLGIDLSLVDTVVISHGHYDHADGLPAFREVNPHAAVYLHKDAFLPRYHEESYIGVSPEISSLPGIVLIEDDTRIDDELSIFGGVTGRRCYPKGNNELTVEINGKLQKDDFHHEIYLVITQHGRRILISGCAHNGILNIMDRFREIYGDNPDVVITGFHMIQSGEYTANDKKQILRTAKELAETDTLFFSGHCTGKPAFEMMKTVMGDQLLALSSGERLVTQEIP